MINFVQLSHPSIKPVSTAKTKARNKNVSLEVPETVFMGVIVRI